MMYQELWITFILMLQILMHTSRSCISVKQQKSYEQRWTQPGTKPLFSMRLRFMETPRTFSSAPLMLCWSYTTMTKWYSELTSTVGYCRSLKWERQNAMYFNFLLRARMNFWAVVSANPWWSWTRTWIRCQNWRGILSFRMVTRQERHWWLPNSSLKTRQEYFIWTA